jgi:thiosulfate reductase/polysulfide reductase chain A
MAVDQEEVVKKGTCPVCGSACFIKAHVTRGKITKVEPDQETLMGWLCERGVNAIDYHYHKKRLNHPLKRTGARGEAKWEHISWEQAMDEIAAKLDAIRDLYGPEAVMVLGGSPHGPGDPAAWKWCNLWGTPNFFHLGKNCGEAEFPIECAMYGYDTTAGWATFLDPNKTGAAIIWGANIHQSEPRVWMGYSLARKMGMKLIVVDPRPTECAKEADIWLQLRPGTDGALALGMLNVIINEGIYDKKFVEKWCLGFEELKALVQQYPPEKVAQITWVPAERIIEASRVFANAPAGVITWGVATCHLGNGAGLSSVLGKCWLKAITGNLDKEGGCRLSDYPDYTAFLDELNWDYQINHPLRTRDNVSADRWPLTSVKGLALYREGMKKVYPQGWGAQQYFIYPAPWAVWEAILTGDPYPIKAAFDQGTNTLCSIGNSRHAYQAFKSDNLELHVSMDHFLTPTGALADYVLPATDALERVHLTHMWGVLGNQWYGREAVVDPEYERRDDYQLWCDLGKRLGQAKDWPDKLEGWLDRILAPSGMSFLEFAQGPGYSPPSKYWRYEETGFGTFSGKVELVPSILTRLGYNPLEGYREPPWSPVSTPELAKEYPLILISGSRVRSYHHSSHRQISKLRKKYPEPLLQIGPQTAAELGIADGDMVYIETPLGRVKQKAQLLEGMHPEVVHADGYWWFPEKAEAEPSLFGVWESNIDSIVPDNPEVCDYVGNNYFRGLLCRVHKAE